MKQETFGERLRALRLKAGLTCADLGIRLDVSTSAISRIETGVRTMGLDLLPAAAKALGCRIDDFFPEMDSSKVISVLADCEKMITVRADGPRTEGPGLRLMDKAKAVAEIKDAIEQAKARGDRSSCLTLGVFREILEAQPEVEARVEWPGKDGQEDPSARTGGKEKR